MALLCVVTLERRHLGKCSFPQEQSGEDIMKFDFSLAVVYWALESASNCLKQQREPWRAAAGRLGRLCSFIQLRSATSSTSAKQKIDIRPDSWSLSFHFRYRGDAENSPWCSVLVHTSRQKSLWKLRLHRTSLHQS